MKKLIAALALVLFLWNVSFAQNNTANVTQAGNESSTLITQVGLTNSVTANESGWLNYTKTTQTGNLNAATVNVTGDFNTLRWNVVHPFTVPGTALAYNGSDLIGTMFGDGITQTGSGNTASLTMNGLYNIAGIGQISSNNQATVSQTGTLGGQNWAAIDQLVGNGNIASLSQNGTDIQGYILQKGTTNNVSVTQTNYNVFSEVAQVGTGNVGTQTLAGSAVVWDGTGSSAKLYQIGNANYAIQSQSGGVNNVSLITTIGNNNGVLGSEIKTTQVGNNNSATIQMGLLAAVNNNLATITQSGDLNTATISVEGGDFNSATIQQLTSGNTANITQNGVSNNVQIVQQ